MLRWLGVALFVSVAAGGAAIGCGGGTSESDAKLRCDQEQASKGMCYSADVYDACLKCFEDCGDQCRAQAQCPEVYKCENP